MFKLKSGDSSNPRTRAIGVGFTSLISGLLLLAVVCAPVALAKGKPDPGGPGLQLSILAVYLTDPFAIDDVEDEEIEIIGLEFDPGDDPLVVTLGPFDLSETCNLTLGESVEEFDHILCDLPQGGIGVAGDYVLVVSHGLGQSEGDEYDLTIAEPPVPEGTIAFYAATACPPGWDEYTAAQGLAIVGLPSGGAVAGGFGTAMGDEEDRTGHTHDVDPKPVDSSRAGGHDHGGQTGSGGNHTHTIAPTEDFIGKAIECDDETETGTGIADACFTFNDYVFVPAAGHVHPVDEAGTHQHTVDPVDDHLHVVDVVNTTSTTPKTPFSDSNEDVLPYIQLLACVKGCISDCNAE